MNREGLELALAKLGVDASQVTIDALMTYFDADASGEVPRTGWQLAGDPRTD